MSKTGNFPIRDFIEASSYGLYASAFGDYSFSFGR